MILPLLSKVALSLSTRTLCKQQRRYCVNLCDSGRNVVEGEFTRKFVRPRSAALLAVMISTARGSQLPYCPRRDRLIAASSSAAISGRVHTSATLFHASIKVAACEVGEGDTGEGRGEVSSRGSHIWFWV
jgi:hypothetical protein